MKTQAGKIPARKLLVCCIAATLLVGCSSGDDASSTSGDIKAPPAELTGEPVKVAHISDIEAEGVTQADALGGVKAGIEAVNDNGGIDGHPIELTAVCNGERNPNAARACIRKAIDDGVVAFVGNMSSADDGYVPLIDQAGVASIGAIPLSPVTGASTSAFCFNGGLAAAIVGLAGALEQAGATKISFIYPGNVGAASAGMEEAYAYSVESSGVEDAGAVGFNLGETQFDAVVATAAAEGVDGIALLSPGEPEAALIRAVKQYAPDVKIATPNSLLTPSVLDALGATADDVLAVAITQPSTATEVPGIVEFNEAMDAHDPDGNVARNDLAINGWASVRALQEIAAGLPEITRESLFTAMESVEDLDLGGIFPPLSAPDRGANPEGLECAMAIGNVSVTVKDGQTYAVEPGQFLEPFAG
ncbi:ABC transporter substrate-binding protein [Microbacterium sp. RD1]|uniref:ABC transporter substrate-binding protein n=1 Tax=Microbacterium sp. RD1 TaxID=3457313 RepID=UPI003FA56A6E